MHKTAFWHLNLDRGKRFLAKHDPESALVCFEQAVASCPVTHPRELARSLFFLGVTLRKLGMANCALKSWGAARRLTKDLYAGRFLQRFSNDYGMAKQSTSDLDDWKAFYSIQLSRYLETKNSKRIGTQAEGDMIWDLIFEAWKLLRANHELADVSPEERLSIFRSTKVVFPLFAVPKENKPEADTIAVDFSKKKKVMLDDDCFCGSSLPYKFCCGRTPGVDEIVNGVM